MDLWAWSSLDAAQLQEIAVGNVHIFSSPEHSGRRYG
jgi:hypothetical protein